ncbi:hypothetical protein [Anianabacter salinae]|uniref:hypothetical protein n=1 Tax=Anianabacter salinae TaxID=2851023 RepID=UPI00225E2F4A|nr:hypothetical protein [Anianabacter salinae]MBV0914235.1 hypothetical protein [Anianabacter salinae]
MDEAESALADFERFAKYLGPDRVQLHGYAFEALGDALAATARQDEARLEWHNALARFESHKPERWQQEIHKLKQKAEGER